MTDTVVIHTLDELIRKFGKEFEIVVRNEKNKRFKEMFQVVYNKQNADNADEIRKTLENVLREFNKVDQAVIEQQDMLEHMNEGLQLANKLELFNAVVGVVNVGVSIAGFIIIANKMNEISAQISEVLNTVKNAHEDETMYKFDKVIEQHQYMLSCMNDGTTYSESKFIDLIGEEKAILNLLRKAFINNTCASRESVLQATLCMASMLASSIVYFDNQYYYNHKSSAGFYPFESNWILAFQLLREDDFIESLQDYFFLDLHRTQYETDLLTCSVLDHLNECEHAIKLEKSIVTELKSLEEYKEVKRIIAEKVNQDLLSSIQTQEANHPQVVALFKEAAAMS